MSIYLSIPLRCEFYSLSPTKVIRLPKSGGVAERNQAHRTKSRDRRIREYFYGCRPQRMSNGKLCPQLSPRCFNVHFNEIQLINLGISPISAGAMPLGATMEDQSFRPTLVTPS